MVNRHVILLIFALGSVCVVKLFKFLSVVVVLVIRTGSNFLLIHYCLINLVQALLILSLLGYETLIHRLTHMNRRVAKRVLASVFHSVFKQLVHMVKFFQSLVTHIGLVFDEAHFL